MPYKSRFYFLCISVCMIVAAACNNKEDQAKTARSHGLSFELKTMQDHLADSGACFYAARLIPDKDTITDPALKFDLLYRMDSCFYMQNGKQKIYPKLVEAVNNGVPGSFEYQLTFDKTMGGKGKWQMVYQDKYLNHYLYSLPLYAE